jgi:redox-sensitive bicupin YhaK (pirin superfamily)
MGDIYLDQPLPHPTLEQFDPFLLIHHWKQNFPGGELQKNVGVGPHPHRGFSPVTLIFEGGIHHRDSLGNNSIVSAGGTQWTNSGKGITHSERPAAEIVADGGTMELIQFWLNTPQERKMEPAAYYPLTAEETPSTLSKDGKVNIQLVSGKFLELSGRIPAQSPVLILRLDFEAGGQVNMPVPQDYSALIYQLNGSFNVDGEFSRPKSMFVYDNEGDTISLRAQEATTAILLAGLPLNEPVVSHGPFVMNEEIEIMQAMRDYQMGKMGVLIEDFN